MRKLYIIRGLPGSGKTTLANELGGVVCEADQFFTDASGSYSYDASKLPEAHTFCQNKVREAMLDGYNTIIVSNTSSRRWMMDEYYVLALKYEYQVTEITLTGKLRESVHNVPAESIQHMKEGWEK
jgi:predicted kinase